MEAVISMVKLWEVNNDEKWFGKNPKFLPLNDDDDDWENPICLSGMSGGL